MTTDNPFEVISELRAENARLQQRYDALVPMYEEEKRAREWERASWEKLRKESTAEIERVKAVNARLQQEVAARDNADEAEGTENNALAAENARLVGQCGHGDDQKVRLLAQWSDEGREAVARLGGAMWPRQQVEWCVACGRIVGQETMGPKPKVTPMKAYEELEAENARHVQEWTALERSLAGTRRHHVESPPGTQPVPYDCSCEVCSTWKLARKMQQPKV